MGGFVSKPATCSEEVVVKSAIRSDDVSGELNIASKTASFDPSTSVPRTDAAQPSQAPRQKPQNAGASLHVNSRLSSDQLQSEWDRALGGTADVEMAEEEEMQRAIEASLREGTGEFRPPVCPGGNPSPNASQNGAGATDSIGSGAPADTSALTLSGQSAQELGICPEGPDEGSKRREDVYKQSASRTRPPEGFKATALGLGGDYAWVDNSDFHGPRVSEARRDHAASRSASCGSKPKYNSNGMRSGIVSLPRITQQLPVEQQVMVKDLHEKIKETISRPGTREEAVRARALGKNASADVLRVMEDLSLDEPLCRGPLQARPGGDREVKKGERFNDNFHSCRARDTRPGAYPAPYPNNGLKGPGPSVTALGAGSAGHSSGVRRFGG